MTPAPVPGRRGRDPAMRYLLLALALTACSREEPPVSVANQSETMAANLEARANALELQADNMADGEIAAAMANAADVLGDAAANPQTNGNAAQ
jgi:hypothetical protein